jgi:hypothetical protein
MDEDRSNADPVYATRIRSIGPPPRAPHELIVLTHEADYEVGTEVTWLWSGEVLGPVWYVDGQTGQYVSTVTLEFRGVALDAIA